MDFAEAERSILSFTDYEKTPGVTYTSTTADLSRVYELLELLGNPHRMYRVAHVAGTKGKGSTSAMIASALTASGRRTGLYTSPHFHTVRERIAVDGVPISENDFADAAARVVPCVSRVNARHSACPLTTFEILTAVAFVHFADQGADYAAIEVGLGGRLDATNIVRPSVTIITSLSLDHTEVLGGSIEAIASEKAGIIKQGCPCVTAGQSLSAHGVIKATCLKMRAPLVAVGTDVRYEPGAYDSTGQELTVLGRLADYELRLPLLGRHQLENAACAVAALEVLRESDLSITGSTIAKGLSTVKWPGRLQVAGRRPWVICDGAHNADSASKLKEAISRHFPHRSSTLVIGVSSDKDIEGIIRELAPAFARVVVTRSDHPRAATTDTLAAAFAAYGIEVSTAASTGDALAKALEQCSEEDLVCVAGSLFVAGEALRLLKIA